MAATFKNLKFVKFYKNWGFITISDRITGLVKVLILTGNIRLILKLS